MDAHVLKQIVSKYFTRKLYAVHYEVGVNKGGALRADVLAINMRSGIVIIETKSSPGDFKSDKKWHNYLPLCDQFYFCMSLLTYKKVKHLVPKGVGVFVVDADTGSLTLVGRSRKTPTADDVRLNIMTRMAYRSANVTRWERKSKSSGAELVAATAIEALYAMNETGRLPNKNKATKIVVKAINKFV